MVVRSYLVGGFYGEWLFGIGDAYGESPTLPAFLELRTRPKVGLELGQAIGPRASGLPRPFLFHPPLRFFLSSRCFGLRFFPNRGVTYLLLEVMGSPSDPRGPTGHAIQPSLSDFGEPGKPQKNQEMSNPTFLIGIYHLLRAWE